MNQNMSHFYLIKIEFREIQFLLNLFIFQPVLRLHDVCLENKYSLTSIYIKYYLYIIYVFCLEIHFTYKIKFSASVPLTSEDGILQRYGVYFTSEYSHFSPSELHYITFIYGIQSLSFSTTYLFSPLRPPLPHLVTDRSVFTLSLHGLNKHKYNIEFPRTGNYIPPI